jgi:hypothetical protein
MDQTNLEARAMTEALDKILNNHTRITRVYELLRSYGADERQADVGSKALADKFEWTGAVLNFLPTGKIAADDPECKATLQKDFSFLLPPPNQESKKVEVDPALLASAKGGNMTSYSKIVRQHGKENADLLLADKPVADDTGAAEAAAAAKAAKAKAAEHSKNPWHSTAWNLSGQGRILRALGPVKAAELASAVGSHIGATRPNPNY